MPLPIFISGCLTMGYAVAALFFAKFWSQSRDRLFGFFSAAFALLAAQRVIVALMPDETTVYVLRLLAFILIIVGIVDKNRGA